MDRRERLHTELYDQNNCCTAFTIVASVVIGFSLTALEVAQLMYIWNLDHLKYRNEQYALFGESCPGVWLGFLFIFTSVTGIIAWQTRQNPERRHVRYTIYASLNLVNVIFSVGMITWIGYTLDRMKFDYPKLCKSFQYAGTYDHICDYENGFYMITGLIVGMMIFYCAEAVVSLLGAILGFRKVCSMQYQQLTSKQNGVV